MEVGKLYVAENGYEYLCLFERDGNYYCSLVDEKLRPYSIAARWDAQGKSLDLKAGWDFVL